MLVIWKLSLYSLIGVFGLVSNSLAVVTLVRSPSLMGESQQLVVSQSLVDAVCSLMLLLSYINMGAAGLDIHFVNNWKYDILCKVWHNNALLRGFMTASTYSLVFLTLDRYLKLVHPFWCRKYYSSWLQKIFLGFPWIWGPVYQISFQLAGSQIANNNCLVILWMTKFSSYAGIAIIAIDFVIPAFIIIACYCRILFRLQNRDAALRYSTTQKDSHQSEETSQSTAVTVEDTLGAPAPVTTPGETKCNVIDEADSACDTIQPDVMDGMKTIPENTVTKECDENRPRKAMSAPSKAAERKVTFLLALVSGAFFCCHILRQVVLLLQTLHIVRVPFSFIEPAQVLSFINCMINPLIYVAMHDKMRAAFLKICCPCKQKL